MFNRLRRNRSRLFGRSTIGAITICVRPSGIINGSLPGGYVTTSTSDSSLVLTCLCPSCRAKAAGDLVVGRFLTSLRKLAE